MDIHFDGFDQFARHLEEFGAAVKSLDGHLATVNLIGGRPETLASAISNVEGEIDRLTARHRGNAMVDGLARDLKRKYREILRARYDKLGR